MTVDATPTSTATPQGSDAPIIRDNHDAETTMEYRTLIATALGCEDARYPSALPATAIRRLYALLIDSETGASERPVSAHAMRKKLAIELDLGDAERFECSSRGFDRYKLVQIADELNDYTYADLQRAIE